MLSKLTGAVPYQVRCPEGDASGAGGTPNGGTGDTPATETVSKDDHKRALEDLHKFKRSASEAQTKLTELEKTVSDLQRKGAEEKGDFKSLYEQKSKAYEELETKFHGFKTGVVQNQRLNLLEGELLKRGLDPSSKDIMDLADLEKMPFEVTNKGNFIVHGVTEVADELQKKFAPMFKKPATPTVNGGGTGGGTVTGDTELTAAYMVELEKKDPAKYKEVFPVYLEQYKKRKSGG